MSATYINQTGLPLSMAVWLASDYYDTGRKGLSVTTLLKPIKQIILSSRVPYEMQVSDVIELVQARTGTALHDSVEKAWTTNYARALKLLGYPDQVIARVKVNPAPGTLKKGDIPVYVEQRFDKEVNGIKVSGEFDFAGDGQVEDIKSTGTYSYMKGTKDEHYVLQGSMYRWLVPEIITKDTMIINFIFTDWSKASAMQQPDKYPQSRMISKKYTLMTYQETDRWVRKRVQLIQDLWDADEAQMPDCTDEELWRSDPVYKYYKNPALADKAGSRSTKNFDSLAEAKQRLALDGGVGVIKTVPGEVKACMYCNAFAVCKQKDLLIASGDLILKG